MLRRHRFVTFYFTIVCAHILRASVVSQPVKLAGNPTYSVADPGCLSRIPDPDFYPYRIPDLGSRIPKQQQKTGVKKNFVVIPFYLATNFTKLNIISVLKS